MAQLSNIQIVEAKKVFSKTSGTSLFNGYFITSGVANPDQAFAATNLDSVGSNVIGVALNDADSGEEVVYLQEGTIHVPSAPFTKGELFVLDNSAGYTTSNLLSVAEYLSILGWAISSTDMVIDLTHTGIPFNFTPP